MNLDARLKELETARRRAGAKVTHHRREVLQTVVETDVHPDAQTILRRVRKRMPMVSFDTVHRTFAFLERHGLISRVYAAGERTRFDGKKTSHHHFICMDCGKIIDFESALLNEVELPAAIAKLGKVFSRQLQVRGVCHDCETEKEARDG